MSQDRFHIPGFFFEHLQHQVFKDLHDAEIPFEVSWDHVFLDGFYKYHVFISNRDITIDSGMQIHISRHWPNLIKLESFEQLVRLNHEIWMKHRNEKEFWSKPNCHWGKAYAKFSLQTDTGGETLEQRYEFGREAALEDVASLSCTCQYGESGEEEDDVQCGACFATEELGRPWEAGRIFLHRSKF